MRGIHSAHQPPWNRLLGPVHPRGGVSGVVRVAGRQIIEWGEPNRPDLTFSVAKTYLVLLTGVAHDRGLLRDLDEPVLVQVPGIGFETAHNRPITWLQLLHQTSEWEGQCSGVPDQVDRYWYLPYQPPRESTGQKGDARPLPDVFRESIAQPVGASDNWRWEGYGNSWVEIDGQRIQSVPGGTHWGGGLSIGSADQALIGQTMLGEGLVGGK